MDTKATIWDSHQHCTPIYLILLRVFKIFPLLKLTMVLLIILAHFFRKLHCNMPGTWFEMPKSLNTWAYHRITINPTLRFGLLTVLDYLQTDKRIEFAQVKKIIAKWKCYSHTNPKAWCTRFEVGRAWCILLVLNI